MATTTQLEADQVNRLCSDATSWLQHLQQKTKLDQSAKNLSDSLDQLIRAAGKLKLAIARDPEHKVSYMEEEGDLNNTVPAVRGCLELYHEWVIACSRVDLTKARRQLELYMVDLELILENSEDRAHEYNVSVLWLRGQDEYKSILSSQSFAGKLQAARTARPAQTSNRNPASFQNPSTYAPPRNAAHHRSNTHRTTHTSAAVASSTMHQHQQTPTYLSTHSQGKGGARRGHRRRDGN